MPQGFKELLEGHGRDLIIRVAASRDVDLSPSLVDLIALMLHPDPQVRSLTPSHHHDTVIRISMLHHDIPRHPASLYVSLSHSLGPAHCPSRSA